MIPTEPQTQLVRLPDQLLVSHKLQASSSHQLSVLDSGTNWVLSPSLPTSTLCTVWICPGLGEVQEGLHFLSACLCAVNANSFFMFSWLKQAAQPLRKAGH